MINNKFVPGKTVCWPRHPERRDNDGFKENAINLSWGEGNGGEPPPPSVAICSSNHTSLIGEERGESKGQLAEVMKSLLSCSFPFQPRHNLLPKGHNLFLAGRSSIAAAPAPPFPGYQRWCITCEPTHTLILPGLKLDTFTIQLYFMSLACPKVLIMSSVFFWFECCIENYLVP